LSQMRSPLHHPGPAVAPPIRLWLPLPLKMLQGGQTGDALLRKYTDSASEATSVRPPQRRAALPSALWPDACMQLYHPQSTRDFGCREREVCTRYLATPFSSLCLSTQPTRALIRSGEISLVTSECALLHGSQIREPTGATPRSTQCWLILKAIDAEEVACCPSHLPKLFSD
jgi:hypothetical protein